MAKTYEKNVWFVSNSIYKANLLGNPKVES